MWRRHCERVRGGVEVLADVDLDLEQRLQGPNDLPDAEAGGALEVAGDRQRREDDGQVGLDRIALSVEHGPGLEVCLAHPE